MSVPPDSNTEMPILEFLQSKCFLAVTKTVLVSLDSFPFNNSFIQIGRKGLLGLTGLLTQGVIDDCCFLCLTSSKYLLLVCEILVYYFCVCNLPR